MQYKKPEIARLAEAAVAIQGSMINKTGPFLDSAQPPVNHPTTAAYEADE
jgi:hypothetical protein